MPNSTPSLPLNDRILVGVSCATVVSFCLLLPAYNTHERETTHRDIVKLLESTVEQQAAYFQRHGRFAREATELGYPASGGASSFMGKNWRYRIELEPFDNGYGLTARATEKELHESLPTYRQDVEGRRWTITSSGQTMPGWSNDRSATARNPNRQIPVAPVD